MNPIIRFKITQREKNKINGQTRQASRRIWNPALKNVLTYLGSADLQSAEKEYAFIGGLQIPRYW